MNCPVSQSIYTACKQSNPALTPSFLAGPLPTQALALGLQDGAKGFFQIALAPLCPNCCIAQEETLWPKKPQPVTLWQSSMALLTKETINITANPLPSLSILSPSLSSQALDWDGWMRGPDKAVGQGKEDSCQGYLCHFFLSQILAVFSQLLYVTDITRQWIYGLKIKRGFQKQLLLFCCLVNFLSELWCS